MFRHFLLVLLVTMETTYCRRVIDLTHTLDENAPKWPLSSFGVQNITYMDRESLYEQYVSEDIWVALGRIEFYEHMGTHMDAPFHVGKGRQTLDQIPVDKLIGPGVVINVRGQAKANHDYAVSVDDILSYEKTYGHIQPKSIVMMNSGWAEKYPNPKTTFGTDDVLNSSTFHFPGFSAEACVMLLQERQVSVVGVDTPSVDIGPSPDYPCHVYLQNNNLPLLEYIANLDSIPANGTTVMLGAMKVSVVGVDTPSVDIGQSPDYLCHVYLQNNNVPLLEYIANLDSIPANGTTVMLGAMKVRGSSGAPVRVLAFIDEDMKSTNGAAEHATWFLLAIIPCLIVL